MLHLRPDTCLATSLSSESTGSGFGSEQKGEDPALDIKESGILAAKVIDTTPGFCTFSKKR